MKKKLFVFLALLFLCLAPTGVTPFQTFELLPGMITYVLCCGKDFNGLGFCENMQALECGSYGGRQVTDCSKCAVADAGWDWAPAE